MKSLRKSNGNLKLLIIGIDGGTFDLILPWVKEGKLPNIARLIKEGVHGVLQSTTHPTTPMAWTTLMTGKNPGKHGIFDFFELREGKYDFCRTNGGFRNSDSIWKILSNSGKRVGVFNMPFTYPPEDINGFVISGFDAERINVKMVKPAKLYKDITKKLGGFAHWSPRKIFGRFYIEDIDYMVENRTKIAKYLLKENPVDIFTVVFNVVDKVQHMFWEERSFQNGKKKIDDVILYTYQKLDDAIGELTQSIGDAEVMIVSDHGAGNLKRWVSMNRWLEQEGLLHFNTKNTWLRSGFSSICQDMIIKGYRLLTEYMPYSLVDAIMRSPIRDLLGHVLFDSIPRKQIFSCIDFSKTKAFSWEPWGYGNIQINVKGLFPQGIVNAGAEYESLRDFIIERLPKLKDPEDGEPVVENVYRREELYHGEFLHKTPDLIVVPHNYASIASLLGFQSKEIFPGNSDIKLMKPLWIAGAHRLEGIFIACGNNIKKGGQVREAKIEDIAPTILHLMGNPIPADMDGRVLDEILQ